MKRRDVLRCIPFSFASIAGITKGLQAGEINTLSSLNDPEPLAIRYNNKVRDMLTWIRETQSENLLEASYAIARTIKNGGRCWYSWDTGHTLYFDLFPERNGVPDIFTWGYDAKRSKKGDLFLASRWSGNQEDLVKKEILVIGSPVPWGGDAKGQEFLRGDVQRRKLRPYSQIWIETNITTHGAVMHIPGMPAPTGPVSGIIGIVTFWMMVADACRILAREGIPVSVSHDEPVLSGDNIPWINLKEPIMDDYFEQIMLQFEMIGAELGDIRRIAGMAVDTVLDGGTVWCYSRYDRSIGYEAQGRRGGLYLTHGLSERNGKLTPLDGSPELKGTSKDLVIMGVWEPDDEVDLKNLDIFRKYGMKVASIGPMTRDIRIPDGRTVPKETDVHVGRMCDTYGLYAVPGFERKVCPTSGALIMQMFWDICMEITEQIITRTGNVPCIFLSGAFKTGNRQNSYTRILYNHRGY